MYNILVPFYGLIESGDSMDQYLIKNTTKEERQKIIYQSLSCGGGGCDACSGCGVYGAGDAYDMYQPYIDGELEISEINMRFRRSFEVKGN